MLLRRCLHLTLAVWSGSLWAICGMVAPTLFALLDDRSLAGRIAGRFFQLEAWLGLVCGVVVLALITRRVVPAARIDKLIVLIAIAGPLVSELVLRSMMDVARISGDMQRFGALHGVSALLYGLACLATAVAIWRISGPAVER